MTLELQHARAFLQGHPADAAQVLERLPVEHRAEVVRRAPFEAAGALGAMIASSAAECLSRVSPDEASQVVDRLPLEVALGLLRRVSQDSSARIVERLPRDKQHALRNVLRCPEGTAATIMDSTVLALPDDISAADARIRIRREPTAVAVVLRTGLSGICVAAWVFGINAGFAEPRRFATAVAGIANDGSYRRLRRRPHAFSDLLVTKIIGRCRRWRSLTTWKSILAASVPLGRKPTSSTYVELHISGLMVSDQ